jgi:predicted porin
MNKKLLAVAISGALVAPLAAQAVDFKISGHINRMIRFADDGKGSDVQHMDNTASRSRYRIRGEGDLGNGMKAGVFYEAGIASNRQRPLKGADGNDSVGDIRHSMLYFSGNFGKVSMGHTSSAFDGVMYADLSGTGLADENAGFEHCSTCLIRTSNGGNIGTLTNYASDFDGGRLDVLRYDSPALGPAVISAAVGNDQLWDIAVNVDHSVGGGKLALYGGYQGAENRRGFDSWGGSVGFMFSQGTNISFAYGSRDLANAAPGRDDPTNWYVKLGHKWGNNAISVSYGETSDLVQNADATRIGVGFIHTLPKPGVELYAGYHNHDVDLTGVNTEDLDVFVMGARVRFQ